MTREYKSIHCDVCDKDYLSNYFYAHKKSKKHLAKVSAKEMRHDLLNNQLKPLELAGPISEQLDAIIHQLKEVKKLIQ